MTRHEAFPGGLLSQVRTLRHSRTHLFPNWARRDHRRTRRARRPIRDLALPLCVVVTDVDTAEPALICSDDLQSALLASTAIPGIYPPVKRDGKRLYDDGPVANVPMRQALAMGARSLGVPDCGFPGKMPGAPQTFAEVLMFTAMISMRRGYWRPRSSPRRSSRVPARGPAPVQLTVQETCRHVS
jgi:NTE family protein